VAVKAVIIEDDAVFRQMLSVAFSRMRGLTVIGSFSDGQVGLDFCLAKKPGLLVVDLFLPSTHGLEIVRRIRAELPNTRILVVTGHPDSELPGRLIAQGVHGFVDKYAPLSYALQAVESVMSGGMFFTAHISPKATVGKSAAVPNMAEPPTPGPAAPSLKAVEMLSIREFEIARLVAEGFSSKEIAARLELSVRTVEKHRANIMDKIGVHEVASLVRWCIQAGIVKGGG
jgi:DNA-binding NarL/FixJ family response regulator